MPSFFQWHMEPFIKKFYLIFLFYIPTVVPLPSPPLIALSLGLPPTHCPIYSSKGVRPPPMGTQKSLAYQVEEGQSILPPCIKTEQGIPPITVRLKQSLLYLLTKKKILDIQS